MVLEFLRLKIEARNKRMDARTLAWLRFQPLSSQPAARRYAETLLAVLVQLGW